MKRFSKSDLLIGLGVISLVDAAIFLGLGVYKKMKEEDEYWEWDDCCCGECGCDAECTCGEADCEECNPKA
ncbi:MAG: hypothetical protein ACRCZJ_02550 [Erysipelotrichaceae bacterium]